MSYSKPFLVAFAVVCAAAVSTTVSAQPRGRAGGRGPIVTGRAVPRVIAPRVYSPRVYAPTRRVIISPRIIGTYPYRPYYYGYRPGITVGFYGGWGYPYGYPYYSYPYARYGYYGYSPYYSGYGYTLPPPGYVSMRPGAYYGGVRIQGAPRDGQVFVDNYYVGIVDDFDGPFQHINLEAGVHQIEIRIPGQPPVAFDVNVQPGQTITYRY